ncbi:MAG: hypothetical protein ACJ762_07295 [Solirubrobacteraceae bacterium]
MLLSTSALLTTSVLLAACGGGGDAGPSGTAREEGGDTGPFRSLTFQVGIDPAAPGTEAAPQGVTLDLSLTLGKAQDVEPPQVQTLDVDFPDGSAYHGGDYPACSAARLDARGPSGCPEGSVMGEGTLEALADIAKSPGRITVVNGGADRLYFWTELDRPARVEAAVVGTITAHEGGGYGLSLKIPDKLQVVAGVPIAIRQLHVQAGHENWMATTGCPDDSWTFTGAATFNDGSDIKRDTEVECD